MAKKTIKTRIQTKNDIKANWDQAQNFKPLKGEMILYTDTKQMKVGDGETLVNALPFYPSGDVTAAGDNIFTGFNTFNQGTYIKNNIYFSGNTADFELLNDNSFASFYNKNQDNKKVDIKSGSVIIYNKISDPDEGTTYSHKSITVNDGGSNKIYTLTLPTATSGTIALTSDIDVTAAGNNTFIGTNKFGSSDYGCTISNASSGHPFCLEGNASNSMQLDFYNSQILFKDARHSSYGTTLQADMSVGYGTANATITLPKKTGTLALTDYVTANPTASSTASLTKLKVGNTVYGLSSGDSSTTVISKTISAWPTATAPVSISFTTDENNKISNKDTFKNIVIQVGVNDKNYVCLYPVGYGNIIYHFASSDNYTLIITDGIGSMTYTKPAKIAGNNTFTGSNTFSTVKVQTNAQTYTTISPTNISGKSGGASYSLVLPVKTSTLATLDDLSSLFTYANNTLTINI